MPRSWGEMGHSGLTALAEVSKRAAQTKMREPRCTKCESFAKPPSLEYWHMGETTMRLRSTTSRSSRASNSMRLGCGRPSGDAIEQGGERLRPRHRQLAGPSHADVRRRLFLLRGPVLRQWRHCR